MFSLFHRHRHFHWIALIRLCRFSFQCALSNQSIRFSIFQESCLTPEVLFAFRAIESQRKISQRSLMPAQARENLSPIRMTKKSAKRAPSFRPGRNPTLTAGSHNYLQFKFVKSPHVACSACRSNALMDRRRARTALKIFEQLIRDAIALLVQRGEIKIPPKARRPPPLNQQTKKQ